MIKKMKYITYNYNGCLLVMNWTKFFLSVVDIIVTAFGIICVLAVCLGLIFIIQRCGYVDELDGREKIEYCHKVCMIWALVVIPICIISCFCWFGYKLKKWQILEKQERKMRESLINQDSF